MDFLIWYYSEGLRIYFKKWWRTMSYTNHYFSTFLLIRTFFAPWKRLIVVENQPGFNLSRYFENLTFNLISRGVGAVVRLTLFVIALFFLIFVLIFGGLIFIIHMIFPLLGLALYLNYKKRPVEFVRQLIQRMKLSKEPLAELFKSDALKFLCIHLNLATDELLQNARVDKLNLSQSSPDTFTAFIEELLKNGVWSEDFLRSKGLVLSDLIMAASWWDKKLIQRSKIEEEENFSRPGIGLELLFGYTPTLNKYVTDLTTPQNFSHHLVGRSDVVTKIERELNSGQSVILVGQPGVGKKTVVLEFARRAALGRLGKKMSYKRVVEFDYNTLLAEAKDLNLKKANLSEVLTEASSAGNIILVIKDIQRLTNPVVEGLDFTDILETHLEKGRLKIIVISTPTDYERLITPNVRLVKYFSRVEALVPSKSEAGNILADVAFGLESQKKIIITTPALRKILDGSDQYITETPFPEKVLELLDDLIVYKESLSDNVVRPEDADTILSEKIGIPLNDLTTQRKVQLTNLESIIHERLVDQEEAINLIAKSLRVKTTQVTESKKPLGSFLLLGPTGVGKTETAKVLAKVYFGSEDKMLRFNLNEYSAREGLERLIGSAVRGLPGDLTTQIKNQPASLLLLDEIEKAPPEVLNVLLALLDEGQITDAMGRKIICRNLFVVATSNAGTENIRQLLSQKVNPADLQKLTLDFVLKKEIFLPEFVNRFDGVVVYKPLSEGELKQVAKLKLNELVANLKKKNIYLEITEELINKVARDGFSPDFGARPMERVINLMIGDIISQAILKNEIIPGDKIILVPQADQNQYLLKKI